MRRVYKRPLQDLLDKSDHGPVTPYAASYFGDANDDVDRSSQADMVLRQYSQAINEFGSFNPNFTATTQGLIGLVAYMYTKLERLEEQVETYEVLLGAAFGGEKEREILIQYLQQHTNTKMLNLVEIIDKVYNSQGK